MRVRRSGHAGHGRLQWRAGVHLADRPGHRVRAALRAAHGGGRQRVHAGGRPVRVVQDGLRAPAGRHRGGPLLGHQPAVGRRLAGLHRHRGVERQHLQDPLRLGGRLPLQVPLHLAVDRRGHRLAEARQVDPERRRAHAHRRPGLLHPDDDHLRLLARRERLPGRRPQADRRDLPRPRPAAALQLRRLRAAERRRRGDERPAEGRAPLGPAQRRHRRAALRDPDLRDPARPPPGEGHRASAASSTR